MIDAFRDGVAAECGEAVPSDAYSEMMLRIDGLADAVNRIAPEGTAGVRAAACEFVLEGLHLNKLLNKDIVPGRTTYRG